jgi:hypothetical protein
MKSSKFFAIAAALVLGLAAIGVAADKKAAAGKGEKTAAELEKEKAMANPYPNDYGPEKLSDDEVKALGKHAEGYKLMQARCTVCHNAARPLNSRFVEPAEGLSVDAGPKRDKAEEAAIAALKTSHPDLFKDAKIWQVEAGIWSRYVKRMLNKPGCGVSQGGKMTPAEAKKIYEFLVFDSSRKIGANKDKWKAHRTGLIEKLKKEKPHRYEELEKDKDL